tara:strand:- start:382 stop:609 length:228 start_codon:yes stop_codon:yes gene_type:complete
MRWLNSNCQGLKIIYVVLSIGDRAREYGPKGVNVSHIIIDGGVEGAIRRKRLPKEQNNAVENEPLNATAINETYW